MDNKVININKPGEDKSGGNCMDTNQIFLMIINERLYNMGILTKEERDKMLNEIKMYKFKEF